MLSVFAAMVEVIGVSLDCAAVREWSYRRREIVSQHLKGRKSRAELDLGRERKRRRRLTRGRAVGVDAHHTSWYGAESLSSM